MWVMNCPEKESLQQKCTAGWDAYVAAAAEAGLSVDPSGHLKFPFISELAASRSEIDPASRMRSVYSVALRLHGEHLRASWELSRHLSKHRC